MAFITVDKEKCDQDGICAAECPAQIIQLDSKKDHPHPTSDFEDWCLKCGHCVAVCPTGAMKLDWVGPEGCKQIKQELDVTPEQAEQFLCGRRSIRTFKEKTVPRNILEKLLEIACMAPSARNQQPWHWTVVEDPARVRELAGMVADWMRMVIQSNPEAAEERGFNRVMDAWDKGNERICRGAPHIIVAHADKNWPFSTEDCTLAISLLDLYATSVGLGACWGGYFYKAVNVYPPLFEALGLPSDHLAFGAIMVGYPKFRYQHIPPRNPIRVTWK